MTCYTGGETVFNNHQFAMLPVSPLLSLMCHPDRFLWTVKFRTFFLADPHKSPSLVIVTTLRFPPTSRGLPLAGPIACTIPIMSRVQISDDQTSKMLPLVLEFAVRP